jgi:hypothetical protein
MFKVNQPGKEDELWNDVHDVENEFVMIFGSVLIAAPIPV